MLTYMKLTMCRQPTHIIVVVFNARHCAYECICMPNKAMVFIWFMFYQVL